MADFQIVSNSYASSSKSSGNIEEKANSRVDLGPQLPESPTQRPKFYSKGVSRRQLGDQEV